MKYDVFISYSRKADGRLAPDIQRALQKLTKPWYKLKALSVFRDQSDLNASPHLWQSIVDALSQSHYFVLMASPEAANSKWVSDEVKYWLENKSVDTLIIVLSSGTIGWDYVNNNFDTATTTALPACMFPYYTQEPAYVEFAKVWDKAGYNLKDGSFIAAVAQIAAPVHGKTVGELIGQDIKEHRRTMLYRNAAIILLSVFLVVSLAAMGFAFKQADKATQAQHRAERSDTLAQLQKDTAVINLRLAEQRGDSLTKANTETQEQRAKAEESAKMFKRQYEEAVALAKEPAYALEVVPGIAIYNPGKTLLIDTGDFIIFGKPDDLRIGPRQRKMLDKLIYDWNESTNQPCIEVGGFSTNTDINEQNKIIGRTKKGTAVYNEKLSQRRGQVVIDYLIKHGIPRQDVIMRSFGDVKPISKGVAFNERVEINTCK